ncbi:MAG: P-II family nitrogen regulator [Ruminiclostridium sp.]|nr:P-II family nitrogen regulator [Ruminiclostridium sp.]
MEYEMIFCVINAGFSDTLMDAAREAGARGGTVIRARGTAGREAEELFKITIHPDKEVVMILVPKSIKDAVLDAVYKSTGMNTAGQGIAFSLPVSRTVGLQQEG